MGIETIVGFGLAGFFVGANIAQYNNAKEWTNMHKGCHHSLYEDKVKDKKNNSKRNLIVFYLGYPSRYLAYKRSKLKKIDY